jgi:hypothetical protein
VIPIFAFASGGRPEGAADLPPAAAPPTTAANSGITGRLEAAAGRYEVVAHPEATSISAQISAGGERFDARFASGITGSWQGDPADLGKPMRAEVRAETAAVDTGISGRSKSARDGYLQGDKHPHVVFTLDKITSATGDGPGKLAIRATGTLVLVGKNHAIEATGSIRLADDALRSRLGVTGTILVVQADFSIAVKDTAFAKDASDFDDPIIPIHVSLVMRHAGS